ncbi:PUA-like domain-containing protein [Flammula alnicola]|nr:PUA-like domain-containing protein [Flammula alnicola]
MTERLRKLMMADETLYNKELTSLEVSPRFGEISGNPVGTTYYNRKECCSKGVHAQTVAGISGSEKNGAYSICVSRGYVDDEDKGEFITYTGTGGQTNSHSGGRQVADQTFEHPDNFALKKSAETKRPVRVVRGPNPKSKYAPARGYRYDGLYIVENAYMGKGKDGFLICQYTLRRKSGLPPLPLNPDYKSTSRPSSRG